VSALAAALLAELDRESLAALADRLAPLLVDRLGPMAGEDSRWLRGAAEIAQYLRCPPSRVYALSSANRLPIHRDGSNLVARTAELDEWLRAGGSRRP
jgi:excisionase family DNA binding protein